MSTEINHIDVLVHPDFWLILQPRNTPLHPRQQQLRDLWDKRVQEIAVNPQALFLYYSCVDNPPLSLTPSNIPDLIEYDRLRVQRYKELLGDRFVAVPRTAPAESEIPKDMIYNHGFQYNPYLVQLYPYGELYGACVMKWGQGVKDILRVPDQNYHYHDSVCKTLSLNYDEAGQIQEWWEKLTP